LILNNCVLCVQSKPDVCPLAKYKITKKLRACCIFVSDLLECFPPQNQNLLAEEGRTESGKHHRSTVSAERLRPWGRNRAFSVNVEFRSEKLRECCFLCQICCSDAVLCKLSNRSDIHVLHVFRPVPRFSDTWIWTALVATLVCSTGMAISSSSFWPFPESWHWFSRSFNDILRCDLFCGISVCVNCNPGAGSADRNSSSSYWIALETVGTAVAYDACDYLYYLQ
jgi:hypothetical protein